MTKASQLTVPVTIEWARLGKEPNDPGYRVLQCSNGELDEVNFKEVLTRYSPGTLEPANLPQVTISWSKDQRQGQHYIGIAIHGRQKSDQGDASGRWVMLTNYFCVPFKELDGAVSYLAMHELFDRIKLPLEPNDTISTNLPASTWGELVADAETSLAMQAAASLLTSDPVCVLGADRVTCIDRLRFIDMVATLLPYGMRSELSASTWASSTYRTHKLRLFFADVERSKSDRKVIWGEPQDRIGHGYADEYLDLLQSGVLTPHVLAGQQTPTGFDRKHVLQVLETLRTLNGQPTRSGRGRGSRYWPGSGHAGPPAITAGPAAIAAGPAAIAAGPPQFADSPATPPADARSTELEVYHEADDRFDPASVPNVSLRVPTRVDPQPGPQMPMDEISGIREILASCGHGLNHGDLNLLSDGIAELRDYLHERPQEARDQLKRILYEKNLFGPSSFPHEQLLEEFYQVSLRLAFASPIRYQAYKDVEKIARCDPGHRLPRRLALAMLPVPLGGAARLLLLNSLDGPEFEFAVRTYPIPPSESVAMLLESPLDQAHIEIVTNMALRNLQWHARAGERDRAPFREAMARNQMLTALHQRYANDPDRLHDTLEKILGYAYEDGLSLGDAQAILTEIHAAPGEAMLAVVLSMVDPKDRESVKREFLLRRAIYSRLSADRMSHLRDLILQKGTTERKESGPFRSHKLSKHRMSASLKVFSALMIVLALVAAIVLAAGIFLILRGLP